MYLRGLGLGLMLASLVMSFGVKADNKTMTDAQIRARALELGMVDESTTLKSAEESGELKKDNSSGADDKAIEDVASDNKASNDAVSDDKTEEIVTVEKKSQDDEVKNSSEVVEAQKGEAKPEEEKEVKVDKTEKPEENSDAKEESKAETKTDDKADNKTEVKADTKSYNLTVASGYSSDRVAKILEDAGVVDSAAAFDKYLCNNGYDHRISTGNFLIPAGSDYESIAKQITHSR